MSWADEVQEWAGDASDQGTSDNEWSTFHVANDKLASWALRKLARATDEMARLRDNVQAEVDGLNDKLTEDLKPHHNTVTFMTERLQQYRMDLEERDPELPRTYKLPLGSLARRKLPPRVDVTDPEAFIAWALDNEPTMVKVTPAKAEIRAATTSTDDAVVVVATGQVVPGVTIAGGEEVIRVTAASLEGGPF